MSNRTEDGVLENLMEDSAPIQESRFEDSCDGIIRKVTTKGSVNRINNPVPQGMAKEAGCSLPTTFWNLWRGPNFVCVTWVTRV